MNLFFYECVYDQKISFEAGVGTILETVDASRMNESRSIVEAQVRDRGCPELVPELSSE